MCESGGDGVTAFAAFKRLLRKLGLHEFPCGFGTWRENPKLENEKKTGTVNSPREISAITLIEHDPNYERVETLLEYATSPLSPWYTDCDWSDEAAELRQIAIKSPQKITAKFICSYFKTLRMRDENVIEIDADLLKLKNLIELSLSANRIVDVMSVNLPPCLKTLELSGNNITDLAPLCVKPPALVLLGLSYNRVANISEHLTAQQWPQLLCLDLFHNNLCDLKEVGMTLKTLPRLQSLVLNGNPIALVPSYRGFLIDCLPVLNILDDITITADERVNYSTLHLHTEYIENMATIKLFVPHVKGIPDPQEYQTDVSIEQKLYFIQLYFIEETTNDSNDADKIPSIDKTVQSADNEQMKSTETNEGKQSPASLSNIRMIDSTNIAVGNPNSLNRSFLPFTNDSPQPTTVLQSPEFSWSENQINFEWNSVITRHNLLPLRDYLYKDLEFKIIERKMSGHLPVEVEVEEKHAKGKGKDDKDAKKMKDKGKKESKPDAKAKNKKTKFPMENVIWSAPEFKVLATLYLSLESFLHGEHVVEEILTKEMYSFDDDSQKSTPPSKSPNNKKDSRGNKRNHTLSRSQSQTKEKKSAESKKGKRSENGKNHSPPFEHTPVHLPPLEMTVRIELEHWTSIEQALESTGA